MNEEKNTFKFKYYAPTENERRIIEGIRRDYEEKSDEEKKFDELCSLHRKVELRPRIAALVIGVIGVLIFGFGMSLVLVRQYLIGGIVVATLGAAISAIAYPIYAKMKASGKEKYAQTILRLSSELLTELNTKKMD